MAYTGGKLTIEEALAAVHCYALMYGTGTEIPKEEFAQWTWDTNIYQNPVVAKSAPTPLPHFPSKVFAILFPSFCHGFSLNFYNYADADILLLS